jgi:hypothetical protein
LTDFSLYAPNSQTLRHDKHQGYSSFDFLSPPSWLISAIFYSLLTQHQIDRLQVFFKEKKVLALLLEMEVPILKSHRGGVFLLLHLRHYQEKTQQLTFVTILSLLYPSQRILPSKKPG